MAHATTDAEKQAARDLLEQIAPGAKKSPELAMFLAMGFATLRDFPRALEYSRRVLRADRDHFQAMALEARIHQAEGRHRECVERLPSTEPCRMVFLHRNLEEVVASQRAMLDRLGRSGAASRKTLTDDEIARVYAGQLLRVQEWLRRAPAVQVLTLN